MSLLPFARRPPSGPGPLRPDSYKWVALVNSTLGVLLVSIDESILIIALPDIFRGISLNPLVPATASARPGWCKGRGDGDGRSRG